MQDPHAFSHQVLSHKSGVLSQVDTINHQQKKEWNLSITQNKTCKNEKKREVTSKASIAFMGGKSKASNLRAGEVIVLESAEKKKQNHRIFK